MAVSMFTSAVIGADPEPERVTLWPDITAVRTLDRGCVSLDGRWQFKRNLPPTFPDSASTIDWDEVTVPGHFTLQGHGRMHKDNGVPVGYRLVFDVPEQWRGHVIVVYFESIDGLTHAWLNGQPVGSSHSAFMPVQFELTDAARPGQPNELLLTVKKTDLTGWYRREMGGIGRSVRLLAAPLTHVSRLHVDTELEGNNRNATLHVHLGVSQHPNAPQGRFSIKFKLSGPGGDLRTFEPVALPDLEPGTEHRKTIDLTVQKPKLWDVEHPNLYTLSATLIRDGEPTMTAQRRFGFRQIKVDGNELRVNGQPIKLRAANYHVTYAGYGHHPPPDLVQRDVRLLVEASLNALRSWPTPPPAYTDACDELGMFTTIEVPMNLMIYAPGPKKDHGDNPALLRPYMALVERMLETYRSHPSVLLWGLANESPYYDYFRQGALHIKRADPSRPVFFGSDNRIGIGLPEMDINDDHYPRNGNADLDKPGLITGGHWDEFPKDRPIMFSEWCHIHVNNRNELNLDPGIDEYWGYYAQTHNEFVFNTPGILGGYIFKAAPYRAIANRTPWRGFFDDDRRLNDIYWHVKKASSPVKLWLDDAVIDPASDTLSLKVTNRHDFTDLSELTITWRQAGHSGRVDAAAPPHQSTYLQVPLTPGSNEPVELIFTHPRGIEVDRYLWRPAPTAVDQETPSEADLAVEQSNGRITVTAGDVSWSIDGATGRALQGSIGNQRFITGGPNLIVRQSSFKSWHGQLNLPVINKVSNWTLGHLNVQRQPNRVVVTARGSYDQARGTFTYTFMSDGMLRVDYDFTWTATGEAVDAFEIGLAFDIPPAFNTVRWERNALWSVYPEWHIGRACGQAPVYGEPRWAAVRDARYVGNGPTPWPWSQDLIDGATRDFRASKFNFIHAGLWTERSAGVRAIAQGRQHFRASPRPGGFAMQISDFHNGGTEAHIIKSLRIEQCLVEHGTQLTGRVLLQLVPEQADTPQPSEEVLEIMD